MSSSAWLPESATEWTDSASIDAEPVITNATNLVAAMPRLAANAASTDLRPPKPRSPPEPGFPPRERGVPPPEPGFPAPGPGPSALPYPPLIDAPVPCRVIGPRRPTDDYPTTAPSLRQRRAARP